MDNQDKAILITEWFLTHWVAIAIGLTVIVVTSFLVAGLTELRKRYVSKKLEVEVEGFVIQKTLAFFAILFGALEYFLPFIQQNIDVLKNIKYVGGFIVAFFAAANYLYAFRYKKWFSNLQTYLEKRQAKLAEKAASDAPTAQSQQPAQPTQNVLDSPFEAEV